MYTMGYMEQYGIYDYDETAKKEPLVWISHQQLKE